MFIIPASVVAKIMMAVTISLHPAAHHAPASYTVHQGDTLSAIAARSYGNSADWPAVWWMNRHQVRNPNVLLVGQRLRLPASGHVTAAIARAAQAAVPAPAVSGSDHFGELLTAGPVQCRTRLHPGPGVVRRRG